MKILFRGNLFNPTGIATANRELVKALLKKGVEVQSSDIWNSSYEFNEGLEKLNNAIDAKYIDYTIFADYPHLWRDGYGKIVSFFLHEGTKLHDGWSDLLNTIKINIVPSTATKNLFRMNGVNTDIKVVPYGTSEIYKPKKNKDNDYITFLYVNSWTGNINDRKGCDLLIKAFDEEFKDEKVKLLLKISTFWDKKNPEFYINSINKLLGHTNKNIMVNSEYLPEEELVEHYQKSDCFVMPTKGESFGLTALNAMACGLPLIITKDYNSGYMDFCRGKDSVLFIDIDGMEQADRRFYADGNLQPKLNFESLKKQLRYAYENIKELKEKGLKNSEDIRKNWSWDKSADKLLEVLK
jgi:hypothetical protein